jgi:hypothetical protein
MGKTSCGGCLRARGFLRLSLSIEFSWPLFFPWKSIWRSKAPLRVAFFPWTAARSKILNWITLGGGVWWL